MAYQVRYYPCPHCNNIPHIKFTEEMKEKILEIECEACKRVFEVDEKNTPQAESKTHPIYRG